MSIPEWFDTLDCDIVENMHEAMTYTELFNTDVSKKVIIEQDGIKNNKKGLLIPSNARLVLNLARKVHCISFIINFGVLEIRGNKKHTEKTLTAIRYFSGENSDIICMKSKFNAIQTDAITLEHFKQKIRMESLKIKKHMLMDFIAVRKMGFELILMNKVIKGRMKNLCKTCNKVMRAMIREDTTKKEGVETLQLLVNTVKMHRKELQQMKSEIYKYNVFAKVSDMRFSQRLEEYVQKKTMTKAMAERCIQQFDFGFDPAIYKHEWV